MTIAKNWSTHSESLVLQVSFVLNIYMKNDYASRNADKDGDQNTDSPCVQFGDNVGIDAELEQLKMNLLEGIQNFETRLV